MKLTIEPLTPERWDDLVELFSRPGASIARGCYCMFYRRSGKHVPQPGLSYSETNKRALKRLVDRGVVPGLLGYESGRAVGWVSLGPREDYARLARSPVMKPVDDKPVWSIVCFFVDARARHRGVADAMLDGALRWARKERVTLLEAYPCDKRSASADGSMWFGAKQMFDRARFVEVARRRPTRPVMRRSLAASSKRASRPRLIRGAPFRRGAKMRIIRQGSQGANRLNNRVPSYHPSPSRPRLSLPAGACDAHCHIFGPEAIFPFADDRTFTPADAPKERLFALHSMLGITRCAIVQSGCHGFDNRVVADAIAAKRGAYCGIALLPLTVTETELESLDARGFRGVRFNYMKHLGAQASIAEVIAMTRRLAEIGWHLQVHFDAALIDELAPSLVRSSVPVVIDHMARIDASRGRDQPAFRALCALMAHDFIWVKVSGSDRCSRQGPPYADAIALARELVQSFGDRVLWGTDWPHPNHTHIPDDGLLVDLIAEIAPSEASRRALLVDNPQRLYRFPDALSVEL